MMQPRSPYAVSKNPSSLDMIFNGGGFTYSGKTYYQAEVAHLEASGNYTFLHFRNGSKLLTSCTLSFWCKVFAGKVIRINRSQAVTLAEIQDVQIVFRGNNSQKIARVILKRTGLILEGSRRMTYQTNWQWRDYQREQKEPTVGAVGSR